MTMNQIAEVGQKYLADKAGDALPVGYKQTDVGVIPEDWELIELTNLCERISVGLATSVTKYYRSKGVPIVRNMNIKDGYFDGSDMLYLEPEFAKANASKAAKALDVITVHTGSNIGLTCLLPVGFDKCQTFTTLITTTNKNLLNPYYLSFHMGSEFGKKEIARLQVGGGKGNLNTGELKQYLLIFPKSIEEQTAIANALSDVDALISELEKLIAKKQAIKTATMQQLLTGRTRLPQFALREDGSLKGYKQSELGEVPEDWEVRCLGGYAVYLGSGKTNTKSKGDFPLYGSTGLIGSCKSPEYDGGAILVARVGANAGRLNFVSGEYGVSDNTIIIKLNSHSDVHFFRYWLIRKNLNTLVFGSGQPLITGSQLKELLLSLPSKEEQTAIATILSDMDEEIQTMEQHLSKTRQIKQGMMQELLTGKTRLIKGETHD